MAELGSQVGWGVEGEGVEGFGEGSDVGLGGGVVGAVQLVGDTFRGGDGLGPRVGSTDAWARGGGGCGVGEAVADLEVGQPGGEGGVGEPHGLAGGVGALSEGTGRFRGEAAWYCFSLHII